MHKLLQSLFEKRGIKEIKDLSVEEKADFERWHGVLSKENLTIDDVKDFCLAQIETVEMRWRDLKLEQNKKAELIPYHTVYKLFLAAIDAPKVAREQAERELTELIK